MALLAGLGVFTGFASLPFLHAQDVNNSSTINVQTNGVLKAETGAYNNLSAGVLNFNGPSGAAEWSAQNLVVTNAGQVNLARANLGIIGDVMNTGQFHIAPLGGIVQVDGHFTNSGTGFVLINGGGMELIGDLGGGVANFTNNSTHPTGVSIYTNRYLVADTITNGSGAIMTNMGRIEGRDAVINHGTIDSNATTSILKGNVTNNGTINARGLVEGNVSNAATKSFTVTGNLAQTGDFTNAGSLLVTGGNLTGTGQLTNTSTFSISNGRIVSATNVKNNTGGTITVGSDAMLSGSQLENSAAMTVGAGGTVRTTSTTTGEDLHNKATGVIHFNGATGSAFLSSGTGKIVNQGAIHLNSGTVLVTGNLTDAGTLSIADGATFKSGSANQTIANAMTLAGTSTIDTNGYDATISGGMTGTGGLAKNGLGNLTLEGTNTFSGPTTIDRGQLTLRGGSAMNDANAITLGANGKLKIQDAETIGSLAGAAGSETNLVAELRTGSNHTSTTYSGKIVGSDRIIKEGTGTMTLDGSVANTFTGGVVVENGTLVANTNEQLGSGTVSVGPNGAGAAGTLQIDTGTTQSVDGVNVSAESGTGAPRGTINNSGTLTSNSVISNEGTINNLLSTSAIQGGVENRGAESILNNQGTIHGGVVNFGTVNNDATTSILHGGLNNGGSSITNNTGTINGGVRNEGTLNSNTATSVISGGLINRHDAQLRNQVSGTIINENRTQGQGSNGPATMTVAGDLVADSTLLNKGSSNVHVKDGNFTGITTLTNQSTHTAGIQIDAARTLGVGAVINQHGSTIVNSGTLSSATPVNNSGLIINNLGATIHGGINNAHANALVTNNSTLQGGITQNQGTVNSLDANSIILGGVNNSAYVNAQGEISGAIVNHSDHSFTDLTLTHAQTNASGTVTFGTGPTAQTFNLSAANGLAVGNEGNGVKDVIVVFDASIADAGKSTYNPVNDTLSVFVATSASATTVQEVQNAINNGSGFTASGGDLNGLVDDNGVTASLVGGRDSGTSMIRVIADATGSADKYKVVSIVHDASIANDSAVASIHPTTGQITVKVRGDVTHAAIATSIDDLAGYSASVTSTIGDQGYQTNLDTPPLNSAFGNGIFNVEGNLLVDNAFTNGGDLNLNQGNLTGITTLTNTGSIWVEDERTLQATTVLNTTGDITLGQDSLLQADTLTNSSIIDVAGEGSLQATGTITNNSTGVITFGLGTTNPSDISHLKSDTHTIVNNGIIDVTNGTLQTSGNISGNGAIQLGHNTTLRSDTNNQSITNSIALSNSGSHTIDTNGHSANVSGAITGNGQLTKSGSGTLTLSGNNTFTGPASIQGGQVQLQGGNAIANATAVQLQSGSLKVSSAETIGSLSTSTGTQTILDASLTTGGNHSSTTSSGLLTGSAGLIKQGIGTMTLQNAVANTYTGGTTIHGGTLVAATNQQLGSGSVSVGTGAILSTSGGTTQTIAGLSNSGSVALGNNSVLNVGSSHLNNAGTINVGSNASILDAGAITNSGTIHFAGGTATLSSGTNSITNTGNINLNAGTVLVKGNIVGNGSINMNNGTTLRSGNANQQIANGIRVNSGTAVIDTNGNDVNLTGSITGAGTLNKVGSGNLTWVGVNSGNALINSGVMITSTQSQVGNVQITNGSGVIFDQSTSGIYSGNMTGNGSFTKSGSGTVTMTGNSSYTGGTNVVGGTLRVGNQGSGQVQSNFNVGSNGTLGGGGTIVGNVLTQQGGRIAAGNSIGTLNISGNLNAGGSVVENELNGSTSDLINVSGTANIEGASLQNQFDATATYSTRMYRALNAAGGVSGRFSSVTNSNAPSDFLISTYYTPSTANVVLTSMSDATLASSISTSLLSGGQDYLSSIMTQVNSYRFGEPGQLAVTNQDRAARHVWFKGVGNFLNIDSFGALPGYAANSGGGIVGIDRALDENSHFGIAGGYTATDLQMRNTARANADVNTARLNFYGAHSFQFFTLSGIGGYAYHDVGAKRNLMGIGTAVGKQSQNEASLNFQLSMNPNVEGPSLMPFMGIQWVHLAQGAYSETGTPGFDMTYGKASVDSLRPYVGMGYQHTIARPSGLLAAPFLFARYSQETIMNSHVTQLSMNGSTFSVAGIQPNRNIVGLGGGINSQFRQNIDWFLNYNFDLGDRGTNHNAGGGIGFKF